MKNIVLMCAGGMSTSIIMKNIKKAADGAFEFVKTQSVEG